MTKAPGQMELTLIICQRRVNTLSSSYQGNRDDAGDDGVYGLGSSRGLFTPFCRQAVPPLALRGGAGIPCPHNASLGPLGRTRFGAPRRTV